MKTRADIPSIEKGHVKYTKPSIMPMWSKKSPAGMYEDRPTLTEWLEKYLEKDKRFNTITIEYLLDKIKSGEFRGL